MSASAGSQVPALHPHWMAKHVASAVGVVVLVVAGVPMSAGAAWSAPSASLSSVTVTADPASGSEVDPGDSITYTLTATAVEPVADGARVVADLSGLLDEATVLSTPGELAAGGLTLDERAETVAWDVPALPAERGGALEASASFRVACADSAPDGAELTATAAAEGETCMAGGPCAVILTVRRPVAPSTAEAPGTSTAKDPDSVTRAVDIDAVTAESAPDQPAAVPSPAEPTSADITRTEGPTSAASTSPTDTSTSATDESSSSAADTTSSPAATSPPAMPVEATGTDSAATDPASAAWAPASSAAPGAAMEQAAAAEAFAGPCTGAAPAAGSPVAGFEIDGNLCTDNAGNIDWDTAGGVVATDGARDSTQFTQGAKESNWPWPPGQTNGNGVAPDSTDITTVYAFTRTVGDVYAFIAFERVATTGTVAYHLELNQLANTFGPTP